MSMWEASEILDMATQDIPEDIMDNEKVEEAFTVVFDWLDKLTDWIDPDSEHYAQDIYESRRDGAMSVVERYQLMLSEALYRQDLFGEQFDLRAFIERLSTISLTEVLEEAR